MKCLAKDSGRGQTAGREGEREREGVREYKVEREREVVAFDFGFVSMLRWRSPFASFTSKAKGVAGVVQAVGWGGVGCEVYPACTCVRVCA